MRAEKARELTKRTRHEVVTVEYEAIQAKILLEVNSGNGGSFLRHPKTNAPIDVNTMIITRCTIPKGTRYFVGLDNGDEEIPSYCSESIIIDEVIS